MKMVTTFDDHAHHILNLEIIWILYERFLMSKLEHWTARFLGRQAAIMHQPKKRSWSWVSMPKSSVAAVRSRLRQGSPQLYSPFGEQLSLWLLTVERRRTRKGRARHSHLQPKT